ncbi:MAG: hypothetical protein Q8831_01775 ['Bonamia sp.' little leaf phytoplasma]|nr:hypothetical protein ['Bonamia sp.' little leaf phytoplasma]
MIQFIALPRTRLTTLIGRKKLVIYGLFNRISIKELVKNIIKNMSMINAPITTSRVSIPKNPGITRTLKIPAFQDHLIQKSHGINTNSLFLRIFFSEWSFGFQIEKLCYNAIKRV